MATLRDSVHAKKIDDNVFLRQGQFDQHMHRIIAHIRGKAGFGRAIFVFDQFGYTDMPLNTMRYIFALMDNAEVILTFATDHLPL